MTTQDILKSKRMRPVTYAKLEAQQDEHVVFDATRGISRSFDAFEASSVRGVHYRIEPGEPAPLVTRTEQDKSERLEDVRFVSRVESSGAVALIVSNEAVFIYGYTMSLRESDPVGQRKPTFESETTLESDEFTLDGLIGRDELTQFKFLHEPAFKNVYAVRVDEAGALTTTAPGFIMTYNPMGTPYMRRIDWR